MRLGYSWWGFLGDVKLDADGNELSTPDGNATYSWSVIYEAQRRGWRVSAMQEDRDQPGWDRHGPGLFGAFSQHRRTVAYANLHQAAHGFPRLDVLLLEWRFPIPGRNTPEAAGTSGYQRDLERQIELLRHYKETDTKIVIWDLDHKLLPLDEAHWDPDAIFETSVSPRHQVVRRTRVEPPFFMEDLLQFSTLPVHPLKKMVYIGSRYERDDVITEYVKHASDLWPGQVEFHGNWTKSLAECERLWPNVSYHDRCTVRDFRRIYGDAASCPLLAKRSYIETGFVTPRPWEALLFGTIPVGIAQMRGISSYVSFAAGSGRDMSRIVEDLAGLGDRERDIRRTENAHALDFMDVRHFVDSIEGVVNGTDNRHTEEVSDEEGRYERGCQ